jgi:hypothetical protein
MFAHSSIHQIHGDKSPRLKGHFFEKSPYGILKSKSLVQAAIFVFYKTTFIIFKRKSCPVVFKQNLCDNWMLTDRSFTKKGGFFSLPPSYKMAISKIFFFRKLRLSFRKRGCRPSKSVKYNRRNRGKRTPVRNYKRYLLGM